jgi:hypothetical protein
LREHPAAGIRNPAASGGARFGPTIAETVLAAILILDDGRDSGCSNIAISGAYWLMAREARRPRLRLWLLDLSAQCAPFFDIDTRALTPEDRDEFWAAARRAFDALAARSEPDFLEKPNSYAANCLHRLLVEKESIDRGETVAPERIQAELYPTDIEQDRWFTDEEVEARFQAKEAEFQEFLARSRETGEKSEAGITRWRRKSMPLEEWGPLVERFGELYVAEGGNPNLAMFMKGPDKYNQEIYMTGPNIELIEHHSPGGWEDSEAPSGSGVALLVGSSDSWERFGIGTP